MFYQIFRSPQVKRCAIITYEHGMYVLPHELPNDVRLRILENCEIPGKYQNPIEWRPAPRPPPKKKRKSPQYQQKAIEKQKLIFSRRALFHTKIRISLKYNKNDCLWKSLLDFNSPQTSFFSLTILVTLRPFTLSSSKVRSIKFQRRPKSCVDW